MTKKRILIVEDEGIVALEIEDALQRLGYGFCGQVNSGEEAILETGRHQPDLVLMDINLKGAMDGIDAAGIIRERFNIPVVYLTAYSDRDTTRRAKLTEPLGYIQKPFQENSLRITLEMAFYTLRIAAEREEAIAELEREARFKTLLGEISRLLLTSSKNIRSFAEVVLQKSCLITGSQLGFSSIVDSHLQEIEFFSFPSIESSDETTEAQKQSLTSILDQTPFFLDFSENLDRPTSIINNNSSGTVKLWLTPERCISVNNYLSVPVFLDNQISGQIVLANRTAGYAEGELKMVEQIGELFAMAIQGHRIEKEKDFMQEQIRQMQKMEAIGTLAGGIAHDFNNILQPIMGYANMAMKSLRETDEIHLYLSSILTASNRARELVQQILTFARRSKQEQLPVRVPVIIKEAIKLIRSTLPSTIEIRTKIDETCGLVMAEPSRIHQIVMNLATNAFHAMQESGGVMEISLKQVKMTMADLIGNHSIPGDYACLTITDDGIGMKKSVLDKIFDPYFTTKGQSKGTGLGLSVVIGIVKSFGGFIKTQSEPGEGSSFHVFLPIIKADLFESIAESKPLSIAGNERILLVDDESAIVETGKSMLQDLGYRITEKNNGVEAFELFRRQTDAFDLIITDMTMPNMTGVELAVKVLTIQPDMPIILCTGFSELINAEKAESIGIKKLLMKPISQTQLGKSIREVLDQKT